MSRNLRRNLKRQCSFCQHTTSQAKLILHATLLRLKKMLQEKRYRHLLANKIQQREENHKLIGRLIITLFEHNQYQLEISKNCEHSKIKNWLINRIECSSQQLQIMINDMCDRVARRNFQLQTISSQIKNVQNSVFQKGDRLLLNKKQEKSSRKKPSSVKEQQIEERPALNQESAQIQQQEPEFPFIRNGVLEIDLSYNLPQNQIPYPYNIIYYGSYFQ